MLMSVGVASLRSSVWTAGTTRFVCGVATFDGVRIVGVHLSGGPAPWSFSAVLCSSPPSFFSICSSNTEALKDPVVA